MRKSSHKRRGLAHEVKKHRLKSKLSTQQGPFGFVFNRKLRKAVSERAAQSCAFINDTTFRLCLVQRSRDDFGRVIIAPLKNRIFHFIYVVA